ncbi:MAG: flavin reductase family protein [Symbiobacterium sp.]|uniref:flavin reductase family protein n=1 Tax=Symbiobacterium sp. TaxID=1971213 RepID=UPI003464940F
MTAFDSRTFRDALGQFLTGVTIVTAAAPDGTPVGLTVNSFTSVSLDPPLVLFCIDKRSGSYAALVGAPGYAVHILGSDQAELSQRFATRGADRFAGLTYTRGLYGAPILPGAVALLECRTVQRVDAGDHTILIGQVERLDPGDRTRRPLGYLRGRYTTVAE